MIAYFDCFAGASGDMILGALIDAGADLSAIRKTIGQIDLGPLEIDVSTVERAGLSGTQVLIKGSAQKRPLSDLSSLLEQADLDPEVEKAALATVDRLREAEAAVHRATAESVHLHEVDAVDTIVDVVGAACAIKDLGITRVVSSAVATGSGMIQTAHGTLPVPPPAVLELMKGRPLRQIPVDGEILTPTGAALLAQWAGSFGNMPPMQVAAIGYGAGARDLGVLPNLLRVIIGEPIRDESPSGESVLLEANIDDMNPEFYAYVTERLFEAGADDVWMVPAIGKHSRPATILSVLAPSALETVLRDIVLSETSTIGVRSTPTRKWALDRHWVEVLVEGCTIRVKVATRSGSVVNIAPEYSDCAEAARRTGLPLKEVFRRAGELGGRERI